MAALTQSAIDVVLGQLSKVVKDEVQLIGGVHRDMKFIKDEMDSMNGFLTHLNKMESEHDDQVRAWMKQVRETAYVAEDCVERYVRDMERLGVSQGGCAAYAAMALLALSKPKTFWELHQLGKQITELRTRVHEVGERRVRYDVKVPDKRNRRLVRNEAASGQDEERRECFVRSLEEELQQEDKKRARDQGPDPLGRPSLVLRAHAKMGGLLALPLRLGGGGGDTVAQLPGLVSSESARVRRILKRCCPPRPDHPRPTLTDAEAEKFRCTKKMFVCALYVYPYLTNAELKQLKVGVEAPGVEAQEARNQVMVFCYSMLSTQQKSCLQYLTAFKHETEISRTSMVRRWVAEGLVGKEPGEGSTATLQEAGERCFRELRLRGFIRPARWGDNGTVKSCVMDGPVQDFVDGITRSENFLSDLPAHLQRQLEIRSIVRYGRPSMSAPAAAPAPLRSVLLSSCCGGGVTRTSRYDDEQDYAASTATLLKHRMDALVDFVKELPKLYRLNVLDLGGCKGLRRRHLVAFTELECLRYLSLRDTDVPGLVPDRHMNRFEQLETLDIRGTRIPPRDTKRIYLPKLKHLLAGRFTMASAEKEMLVTVDVPDRIGSMRGMETLSRVRVSVDGAELERVAKLRQLRKLGVVVHANTATAAVLGRVLYMLAGSLRSLSVWVVDANADAVARTRTRTRIAATSTQQGSGGEGILHISSLHEIARSLALENLHIKGKVSLPSWIGTAPKLTNVTLSDTEMDGGDALRRLATVVNLCCLKLSRNAFTEQALHFKDVQFQALRFLVVEGDAFTRLAFSAGDAAPKLERIVWSIGGTRAAQKNEELIVGIQHLPSLKRIELRASFREHNLLEWMRQQRQTTTSSAAKYRIYYVSSSTDRRNQTIAEVPKAATDTTLTLPAAVIHQLT
jgi:hypothetical protein